jgi:hypothetical protein
MMASQMKWYQFENWLAKELYDSPSTVDCSELMDELYLKDCKICKVGDKHLTKGLCYGCTVLKNK